MAEHGNKRKVSVFSWEKVNAATIRPMLDTVYREAGRHDHITELKRLSDRALRANAAQWLGTPPRKLLFTASMVSVLRERWLPKAPAAVVNELVAKIQLTLIGKPAKQAFGTKADRLAFVQARKVTPNLTVNIRSAFIAAHRLQREVDVKSPGEQLLAGPVSLVGTGEVRALPWYPHQIAAQKELDRLWRSGELHGRLVLPTGAGKTDTVAGWLLNLMARDDRLRVLWLVHQQELAAQAVSRFVALAANQRTGFERRARAIYTGANTLSTLSDNEVAVAAVTYQSFRNLD